MSQLSFSFAIFCGTECDFSSRWPGQQQLIPLNSCADGIKEHLRDVNVSQSCVVSEKKLILACVGLFEDDDGRDFTICPKHRTVLGVRFRPSTKCQHPLHGNRKGKGDRGVNLKTAKEIKEKWNTVVPVCAGICRYCRGAHSDFMKECEPPSVLATLTEGSQISATQEEEFVGHTPAPSTEHVATESTEPEEEEFRVRFQDEILNEQSDPNSDIFSSSFQGSLVGEETSREWQPTPQVEHQLQHLNSYLLKSTDGRISPVRSQCRCDVVTMSSSTRRYYGKKAEQVVDSSLEAIAPGNSSWLLQQVCAASQKKSLAGLDSMQTDGVTAISSLEVVTSILQKNGFQDEEAKGVLSRLKAGKRYVSTDYKLHIATETPCADHCNMYAGSSNEAEYRGTCSHQHNINCDRCSDLRNAVLDIQVAVSELQLSNDEKREELLHDLEAAIPKLEMWKSHVIRSVHQDAAKTAVVDALTETEALLIMDWAMKFLPTSYQETQRDWFGKKGLPWHITVAITKDGNEEIEVIVAGFATFFEEFLVEESVQEEENVLEEFLPLFYANNLLSDNAGCYHCAYLLLSLPSIGDRTGVKIARYDFSEPQAGKDICDRRTAAIKSHIRRFLNEGNDVKSANDMKTAIESYGGIKGCYAAVCLVQPSAQTMSKHNMAGIQSLHNFSCENGGIRVWRAYNVGPGKFYSAAQLARFGTPQGPTKLVIIHPFGRPHVEMGTYRQQSAMPARSSSLPGSHQEPPESAQADQVGEKVMFHCQEEGCIKTFQSFASL
ncbi:unnamed protein product [Porites evermanni]|uniref:Uncharacterized protein n=1 Tax=Porites evermanni TaxID=104178 RepID=A0ABN8PKK5_9CNID|nr:unnamed protein product [Porites evermanni]